MKDDVTERMKQQIEAEMRRHGMWRDDVEPMWVLNAQGLTCTFPTFWDVPQQGPRFNPDDIVQESDLLAGHQKKESK